MGRGAVAFLIFNFPRSANRQWFIFLLHRRRGVGFLFGGSLKTCPTGAVRVIAQKLHFSEDLMAFRIFLIFVLDFRK